MKLRAFRTTVLVLIDEDEDLNFNEPSEPRTLDEIKTQMLEGVYLDLSGDDIDLAIQSVEINWESLEELSPEEVGEIYGGGDDEETTQEET